MLHQTLLPLDLMILVNTSDLHSTQAVSFFTFNNGNSALNYCLFTLLCLGNGRIIKDYGRIILSQNLGED